jgi:hypothetical protein
MKDVVRWHARRDELFDDIRDGMITPDQAEDLAKAEGLEPLLPLPDPALYDPLKLDGWTIMMVLAWGTWRTTDAVREYYQPWRERTPYWGYFEQVRWIDGERIEEAGYSLVTRKPPCWALICATEALRKHRGAEARRQIWRAAMLDDIVAIAFDYDLNRMVEIPACDWYALRIYNGPSQTELRYKHQSARPRYSEVEIKPADAMRLFKTIARQPVDGNSSNSAFAQILTALQADADCSITKKALRAKADPERKLSDRQSAMEKLGTYKHAQPGRRKKRSG